MHSDTSDIASLAALADEALAAQAAREGSDGAAFTTLMERYREKVWRVCWRLMSAQHDAEDAAQEVFVRLFFERGKFAGRSSYSTWLHGVAIRTCLTLRRSRSRRRRREEPGTSEQIESHESRQSETAAAFDASHDVVKLLAGLDEEDRALMLMKFAEGHEYDALAEMFGSTSAALRMRVSRIKERLAGQAGRLFGESVAPSTRR
jgi:RNA polymerase sigma-70 factor (ECF subfamily)